MENLALYVPVAGLIALAFAFIRSTWVMKQDEGDDTMKKIAKLIREGAMAFLAREYKVLAVFVAIVAVVLGFAAVSTGHSALVSVSFIVGAVASGLAGFFGMRIATFSNSRTTAAARTGLPEALKVAFTGGSVMGMSVVGLALLGLGVLFLVFTKTEMVLLEGVAPLSEAHFSEVMSVLAGFSMGASSIALFARVGGGIYTKAADVGADLVGKVEAGLPEDDPRNPATIADNVGDNVGDVAGMGADLFESYVGAIIGSMVLGLALFPAIAATGAFDPVNAIMLPMTIAAVGVIVSIIATSFVRVKEGGNPQHALDAGAFGAAGIMAIITFFLVKQFWPAEVTFNGQSYTALGIWIANAIGLGVGVFVGLVTNYYCGLGMKPVNEIAEQSKTGEATNIIAGLAVGMESTMLPVLAIALGVWGASYFAGLYGVALAALGMLSTTGIQLAVDAYGPIADNAGGIAEMSHQKPEVRERTDKLDAVGNTTAAIGKGFAIASAAMTALALFAAFMTTAKIDAIDVSTPTVTAAMFIGGMLPFLFSALAMKAVGRSAMDMIEEVRRQFREIPGLLEGTADPDPARCVDISTKAAIREMMLPGLIAVISPVIVGFMMGPEELGGLLAGVTVTGVLMAIFMSNAGGAWDNAKKSFEGGGYKMADGEVHPKGSPAHNASVVGDTVGDPFKDTAGPSLNILVKLMSVVALVMAPMIALDDPAVDAADAPAVEAPAADEAAADEASLDNGVEMAVVVDGEVR